MDFFRNFTVDVVGVGDVCSFAQMDVKRHGNPEVCMLSHKDAAPSQMLDQFSCQLPEFLSCISADTIIVIIEAIYC